MHTAAMHMAAWTVTMDTAQLCTPMGKTSQMCTSAEKELSLLSLYIYIYIHTHTHIIYMSDFLYSSNTSVNILVYIPHVSIYRGINS